MKNQNSISKPTVITKPSASTKKEKGSSSSSSAAAATTAAVEKKMDQLQLSDEQNQINNNDNSAEVFQTNETSSKPLTDKVNRQT